MRLEAHCIARGRHCKRTRALRRGWPGEGRAERAAAAAAAGSKVVNLALQRGRVGRSGRGRPPADHLRHGLRHILEQGPQLIHRSVRAPGRLPEVQGPPRRPSACPPHHTAAFQCRSRSTESLCLKCQHSALHVRQELKQPCCSQAQQWQGTWQQGEIKMGTGGGGDVGCHQSPMTIAVGPNHHRSGNRVDAHAGSSIRLRWLFWSSCLGLIICAVLCAEANSRALIARLK